MADIADRRAFRFEGFVLVPSRRSLTADSEPIALRPKSFDVLCALVENAGCVVPKDELVRAAWPGLVVTDDSLTQCVVDIRRALGAAGPRLVKTLPRRGYSFAAPVDVGNVDDETALPGEPGAAVVDGRRRSARRTAVAAGVLVASAAALAGWLRFGAVPASAQPSIAVMPFDNPGGDPEQSYFCDGLSDDVTARLAEFRELVVIAHSSALVYRDRPADAKRVGRELGVRYVIEGSVRREARRVRVSVRLVEAETGIQRWSETFDRETERLFEMQDDLAQSIVAQLVGRVSRAEIDRSLHRSIDSLAAYDHFLRGKAALQQVDAAASPALYAERLLAARASLLRSIEVEPRYAPALAALSDGVHRAWIVRTHHPALASEFQSASTSERALELAQAAVEVDPYLAEAHTQLGWVLHWRYRRDEALAEFRQAVGLNPNLADGRYTLLLAHAGRAEEGLAYMQRVTRLDPFHRPMYFSYVANAHYLARHFDEALRASRLAVDRVPSVYQASVWHAASAAKAGQPAEARAAAERAASLRPGLTIGTFLATLRLARQEDSELLAAGLRGAGVRE